MPRGTGRSPRKNPHGAMGQGGQDGRATVARRQAVLTGMPNELIPPQLSSERLLQSGASAARQMRHVVGLGAPRTSGVGRTHRVSYE